jgi:hypothetical protein
MTNDLEAWSTEKLGQMIPLARKRVQEAQAAFEASQQEERRLRKRTYASEQADDRSRRAEDELEALQAELRRRAVECNKELPEHFWSHGP